jgi:serine/threonine protein kinase
MLNQQFGNYKFLSVLGEGGMATVYLAENTLLGKKVAIKLLKQEFVNNSNIRGRFLAEARHMVQVSHAYIISVLDLIDAGDIVAIVMEYVDGQSLKENLHQKGRLNDSEIRTLFSQILTALQHVHDSGFVHRDIKPSNFMLTRAGSIKLADFGIAKDLNKRFELTETGTQIGTPIYMSPEQVRDSKDVDCRSDIYSLGVVLYEAITGSFPFDKDYLSLPEIQVCILKNKLPLTHTKWDQIIQKATAKNSWERYASCNAFIHDFLDETIPPLFPPPPPTQLPPKQPNTIKPITVISVIAIVGLISIFSYKVIFPPSNKISLNHKEILKFSENDFEDLIQKINSGKKVECGDCDSIYSTENFKYRFEIQNQLVKEIFTQKNPADTERVNNVHGTSQVSFPYSNQEIVDFLTQFYEMINSGSVTNFEFFFEPVIEQFFLVSQMNRQKAKENYEDNNIKTHWSQTTYERDDINIKTNSEAAVVTVRVKLVTTNKSDYSVKNYDILHYFSISKNLKISKLREEIIRRY